MDRLIEFFNQLVRKAVAGLPYAGVYPYSVQSCDKLEQTLDARSLSAGMPDLTGVPMVTPGLILDVPFGTQVMIGFRGLDPTAPYVASYQSGAIRALNPASGSGIINEVDAGSILITQTAPPASVVAAAYFPAGFVGAAAAEVARLAAISAGLSAILLSMGNGRVTANPWSTP